MIFALLDIYFALLPILFFVYYWNKSKSETGIWIVFAYSFTIFSINILMLNWDRIPILYDCYTLIEFLLFNSFLFTQIENATAKKLVKIVAALYTVFYFTFIFFTKNLTATYSIPENTALIDSVPIGVETIIVLSFSFYYLYERMKDTTTLFIYNTYQFWIVLGIVLYLAGSFFVYIFSNYLTKAEVLKYWVITNIFSIIRSCFFTLAIINNAKPTKNKITSDFEISYIN